MVYNKLTIAAIATLLSVAQAGPLGKRIAQTIDQSTAQWEQACVRPCPLSHQSFLFLLTCCFFL